MSWIIGEHVTQSFGQQVVLRRLTFRVGPGERIGLVGPNGQGKTTLLKLCGGMLTPTTGQVHRRRDLRIGYLPQDPPAPREVSIREAMEEAVADLRAIEQQLHDLAGQMGDGAEAGLMRRYDQLQAEFETRGGYRIDDRIRAVLEGLHFPQRTWGQSLATLSGGQRTRAYLARLLIQGPEVLMLDEPTNHLDLDSVEWLEGYLSDFAGAILVVSHDRYFLDRVTGSTWEVAHRDLETYPGSYSKYVQLRKHRYAEQLKTYQAQQEYIAKTREFIAKHISGQRTKEAQGRRTRLERFIRDEAIGPPPEQGNLSLTISPNRRSGEIVLRGDDLVAGYEAEHPLVTVEELRLMRGQKVAIVGPNGSGKTTLLRTLLGQLEPLAGTVKLGSSVDLGYLSQTHRELDVGVVAADAVASAGCTPERARSLLGALLLTGDESLKPISQLSGGQRSRVLLARLAVQGPNLLALDEPTNHLDMPSVEIMQQLLQAFGETILFVSHDRYLVEAVASEIWAIDEGAIKVIRGGWQDYLQWRTERAQANAAPATPAQAEAARQTRRDKQDRKQSYEQSKQAARLQQRLQRRTVQLEGEIDAAESELAALQEQITSAGAAGEMDEIHRLGQQYQQTEAKLKQLWDEWEQVGSQLQ